MEKLNEIKKRIKDLREFSDYSIEDFSKKLGIPTKEYEDYETGTVDIPIGALYDIAAALGIDPTVLLTGVMSGSEEANVTYEGQGVVVKRYEGYSFTTLCSDFIGRKMEPMIVELKTGSKPEMVSHKGQEFNYVIEGSLRVIIGRNEYFLRSGDCVYFNPNIPHTEIAMSETAKFLVIITD